MLRCGVLHFVRGFPLWYTVTAQGPTVSFAVLPHTRVFGLTVNATAALPVPLVTAGTSHVWFDAAFHPQPALVITLTSPLPPAAGAVAEVGDTL